MNKIIIIGSIAVALIIALAVYSYTSRSYSLKLEEELLTERTHIKNLETQYQQQSEFLSQLIISESTKITQPDGTVIETKKKIEKKLKKKEESTVKVKEEEMMVDKEIVRRKIEEKITPAASYGIYTMYPMSEQFHYHRIEVGISVRIIGPLHLQGSVAGDGTVKGGLRIDL